MRAKRFYSVDWQIKGEERIHHYCREHIKTFKEAKEFTLELEIRNDIIKDTIVITEEYFI
jgi:hypothetical protein